MRNLDCKDIKALLSPLVDGVADEETRHAAERHLAECSTCRAFIDEAETNDAMVAASLDSMIRPLPAGLEDAVLSRTVRLRYSRPGYSSLVTWLGWVAAAAAITLAVSIYVFDRQPGVLSGAGGSSRVAHTPSPRQNDYAAAATPASSQVYMPSDLHRSTIYDGPLPVGNNSVQSTALKSGQHNQVARGNSVHVPAELMGAHPLADPVPAQTVKESQSGVVLSREDAETLSITALLVGMLGRCDLTSFRDAEEIRQIAEYDELPERLARARNNLPESDRQIVLVAESMLTRIVLGPISLDDLREMRKAVVRLDLRSQLESIGEHWEPADTL